MIICKTSVIFFLMKAMASAFDVRCIFDELKKKFMLTIKVTQFFCFIGLGINRADDTITKQKRKQ